MVSNLSVTDILHFLNVWRKKNTLGRRQLTESISRSINTCKCTRCKICTRCKCVLDVNYINTCALFCLKNVV